MLDSEFRNSLLEPSGDHFLFQKLAKIAGGWDIKPKMAAFFEKIADFEGHFGRDGGFHTGVFIRRFRRLSRIKSF